MKYGASDCKWNAFIDLNVRHYSTVISIYDLIKIKYVAEVSLTRVWERNSFHLDEITMRMTESWLLPDFLCTFVNNHSSEYFDLSTIGAVYFLFSTIDSNV